MTGSLRFWHCPDCGEMHDKYDWPDNHRRPGEALCAPAVISDSMPAVQSMVDGKMYDSKHALRATYQPSGNKEGRLYQEIGNDPARHKPFKRAAPDRKAIKTALERSAARVENGERTEHGKRLELTRRTTRKPHKHVDPPGPPVRSGVIKPSF